VRQVIEQIDNPFYAPFPETLIKGEEDDEGRWIVYLQASNELKDQDGEIVDVKALQKAADYYMGHGVLSWDHKHKVLHDPKYIIGEPLDVQFTPRNETLVKGFLYQANEIAKSLWNNIKSKAKKLGASIGGGILHKAKERVAEIIWDETAFTHKPINDGTLGNVQLIPFPEFLKALMAGSGVDASAFTGGRALIHESLQGNSVNKYKKIEKEQLDELFKSLMQAFKKGQVRDYNDMVMFVLDRGYSEGTARKIINHVSRNMKIKLQEVFI
jgi:hypothetical protein